MESLFTSAKNTEKPNDDKMLYYKTRYKIYRTYKNDPDKYYVSIISYGGPYGSQ